MLLTSPDVGIVTEKRTKVLPFGRVPVYRPAFTQLGDDEPGHNFHFFAIVMRVHFGLGIDW